MSVVSRKVTRNLVVSDLGWVSLPRPIRFQLSEYDVVTEVPRRVRNLYLQQFSKGRYVSSISFPVEELPAFINSLQAIEIPDGLAPPPDPQLRLNGGLNGS